MTIYQQLLTAVSPLDRRHVEAARRELEMRAAPLRGGEPEATQPISPTQDDATRAAVARLFDDAAASAGLVDTCAEARLAVEQLIDAARWRA